MYGGLIKGTTYNTNYKVIVPVASVLLDNYNKIEAFSFNPFIATITDKLQIINNFEEMVLNIADENIAEAFLKVITRITKEEFYNLNND